MHLLTGKFSNPSNFHVITVVHKFSNIVVSYHSAVGNLFRYFATMWHFNIESTFLLFLNDRRMLGDRKSSFYANHGHSSPQSKLEQCIDIWGLTYKCFAKCPSILRLSIFENIWWFGLTLVVVSLESTVFDFILPFWKLRVSISFWTMWFHFHPTTAGDAGRKPSTNPCH